MANRMNVYPGVGKKKIKNRTLTLALTMTFSHFVFWPFTQSMTLSIINSNTKGKAKLTTIEHQ